MIAFALCVALATLAAGLLAAGLVARLPSLRLRIAGLALAASLLPIAAILLSGTVMFESGHDFVVLAVAAASSTAVLAGAVLLGRAIVRPVDRLRATADALARGDLAARAPSSGPGELAALARSVNEMAARLGELFDARRELVAWASHDLRTPLASLQAMIEALEDGLAEPDHYLPAMRERVRILSDLVDDLFELARIDAGALTLELREATLDGVVERCVRGLEAEASARGIRLEARLDGVARAARCAPDKVERVLYNLLTNALRHTPTDGSVAVLLESRHDELRIAVEDSGDGLPAETLRRMFDRFWRPDAARSRDRGGAGLGLAIARGLVEAQGGRIWAENRTEGGARIVFTLPAAGA